MSSVLHVVKIDGRFQRVDELMKINRAGSLGVSCQNQHPHWTVGLLLGVALLNPGKDVAQLSEEGLALLCHGAKRL